MVKLFEGGAYLLNGREIVCDSINALDEIKAKTGKIVSKEESAKNTMAFADNRRTQSTRAIKGV